MASALVHDKRTGRQLTSLGFSVMKEVAIINPLMPVWARQEALFSSNARFDEQLLAFYAEKLFIEDQVTVEEESGYQAAQQAIVAVDRARLVDHHHIILAGLVFSIQSSMFVEEAIKMLTTPIHEQQVCRPYPVRTEILFDGAAPAQTAMELALCSLFDPEPEEFPAIFMRPAKQVEFAPTPELLDTDVLKLYPTLASLSPMFDLVSQILECCPCEDEDHEISSKYEPSQGRSLMHPPPPCTEANDDEYKDDK
jgi:hypothetical protein